MAQGSNKNSRNHKFSQVEKLTINALIFVSVLILGFLVMLLAGKMVIPL